MISKTIGGKMKPRKFRKRPVVIEAMLFDGSNFQEARDFCVKEVGKEGMHFFSVRSADGQSISINTREGILGVRKGDWIIKGVKGEFYPCGPEIFEMTYEEVA